MLPHIEKTNPIKIQRVNFSFKNIGEKIATHKGAVVTRTTELATLVYSRDVIQKAKWNAKKMPDNANKDRVLHPVNTISRLNRLKQKGARMTAAIAKRYAAITREGASF